MNLHGMKHVLIAGVGNVFFGDDGFGVEVARTLSSMALPGGATVRDFGIRGLDLAYALLDGCDAAVLIDAVGRGGTPGTLYVLRPDNLAEPEPDRELAGAHALVPARVFDFVRAMGGTLPELRIVGCEPQRFGSEDEPTMTLSPLVQAAIEPAAELALEVAVELLTPAANPVIERGI